MSTLNESPKTPKRLVVGISGASGAIYGVRALEILKHVGVETHLVVSRSAALTLLQELDMHPRSLAEKASVVHSIKDVGATISSGSFQTEGMLIAPCSIRTLSEIATGVTSSLLSRAADVTLKEHRRLVLMVRETPLHLGHLRTLQAAAEAGAIIMPPVPAFYTRPDTLNDIVNHSVGRALDLFGIESHAFKRWEGMNTQV